MSIETGSVAPNFSLTTADGGTFSLSEALTNGPVVLVFFPFAFSGKCQGELCEIRDSFHVFADAGVQVVAVSCDAGFAQAAWAEQQGYDFPFVSDFWPHGDLSRAYGVFDLEIGAAKRGSFLIGTDGVVVWSVVNERTDARDFSGYVEAVAALAG